MTTMPTELLIPLRDVFANLFSEEGLADFILALGLDPEFIDGKNKSAKARELALHLWRHSMLDKLAVVGPKERPDIDWLGILGLQTPATNTPAGQSTTKLGYRDLQTLVPILADYPMFQTPDGRRTVITLSGIESIVNVDLNGNPRLVASNLIVQLNDYGLTQDGDSALGRLLRNIAGDQALPPAQANLINAIIEQYHLP